MIDSAWFGGARSGTDATKLVGLGVNAIGYGVAVALALGGEITHTGVRFAPDRNEDERTGAVVNILKANAGEASMMARCAGKTRLHNIEPEDLRSITRATAAATGIPLTGTRSGGGRRIVRYAHEIGPRIRWGADAPAKQRPGIRRMATRQGPASTGASG